MFIDKPHSSALKQRAFSLIELVFFIAIVSIALAGVLSIINLNTSRSVDPQMRKQALAIAEGLLEEIELAHFTFCDPTDPLAATATSTAGCTSASYQENFGQEAVAGAISRPFDNVNDYVTASGVAQNFTTNMVGAALPSGYTASVTITADSNLGPSGSTISSSAAAAGMNALRISVTVSFSGGSVTLDGYRTRYAPNFLP